MKIKISLLSKTVIVAVLLSFICLSPTQEKPQVIAVAQAQVSNQAVVDYLTANYYKIITLEQVRGSEDWVAHTVFLTHDLITTVYVKGDQIIGHGDVAF